MSPSKSQGRGQRHAQQLRARRAVGEREEASGARHAEMHDRGPRQTALNSTQQLAVSCRNAPSCARARVVATLQLVEARGIYRESSLVDCVRRAGRTGLLAALALARGSVARRTGSPPHRGPRAGLRAATGRRDRAVARTAGADQVASTSHARELTLRQENGMVTMTVDKAPGSRRPWPRPNGSRAGNYKHERASRADGESCA